MKAGSSNRAAILGAVAWIVATATHASEAGRCDTVATLSPALASVVHDLLGAESARRRLLGVSAHSPLPADFTVPEVASAGRIDVERILKLRPDCVIEAPGVLPSESLGRFHRIAAAGRNPIEVVSVAMDSLAQISAGYRTLGVRLGVPSRGVELSKAFDEQLSALRGRLAGLKVFVQVDDNPLIALGGRRTFLSEALSHLGVRNVFSEVAEAYPRVSLESVVAAAPDRIWILGEPENSERYERMARSWKTRFPGMKAVSGGGVRVILSRELTLPALALVQGLEKVARDEVR